MPAIQSNSDTSGFYVIHIERSRKKNSAVLILSMSKDLSEAFQRFGEVKSCATIFGQQKSRRSPRLGVSLFYGVSAAK